MPAIDLDCNVKQAYEFKKDSKATVGYITQMLIGGHTLPSDQTIKDPLNPDMPLAAVAVLSTASWTTGPTDPMYFTGQLSAANMQAMRDFMSKGTDDISVEFKFACYEYDFTLDKMGKVFKGYHSGDALLRGSIVKKGNELDLHVDSDPQTYPQRPMTFLFGMGIVPAGGQQPVQLATSDTVKFTLPWGS
jgi:hypothetical protein